MPSKSWRWIRLPGPGGTAGIFKGAWQLSWRLFWTKASTGWISGAHAAATSIPMALLAGLLGVEALVAAEPPPSFAAPAQVLLTVTPHRALLLTRHREQEGPAEPPLSRSPAIQVVVVEDEGVEEEGRGPTQEEASSKPSSHPCVPRLPVVSRRSP